MDDQVCIADRGGEIGGLAHAKLESSSSNAASVDTDNLQTFSVTPLLGVRDKPLDSLIARQLIERSAAMGFAQSMVAGLTVSSASTTPDLEYARGVIDAATSILQTMAPKRAHAHTQTHTQTQTQTQTHTHTQTDSALSNRP